MRGNTGQLIPLLVLTLWTCSTYGARILCLAHQFKSKLLKLDSIGEALIKQGHEVSIVLSDKLPKEIKLASEKGFNVLKYHTPEDHLIMASSVVADAMLESGMTGASDALFALCSHVSLNECMDMDKDVSLNHAMKSLNFDLAIIDIFPLSACLMFWALKLEIPFVVSELAVDMDMMRTPALPSFTPVLFMASSSDDMTLSQRLQNSIFVTLLGIQAISPINSITNVDLIHKYSKDPNIKSWKELAQKAELFFISEGPTLEYAFPLTPNVIVLECLTCKAAKPVPADIELMMLNYKKVTVVSFGSTVSKLPNDILQKFVASFIEMKEVLFIWRFKGKLPSNIPSNVKIMKWIPQNDLLGHAKTKLFITHSGNNGQYESIYHGTPMLCFAFYADQPHNAHRVMTHGYGLKVNFRDFTTEELVLKIRVLLYNTTYLENAGKASRIMRKAPMNAAEKAVFWTEHLVKFGGDHLKPQGFDMKWYSYYMIDVFLFAQVLLGTFGYLVYYTCICILKWVRSKEPKALSFITIK